MTGNSSCEIIFRNHRQGKLDSFDVYPLSKSSGIVRNVKLVHFVIINYTIFNES